MVAAALEEAVVAEVEFKLMGVVCCVMFFDKVWVLGFASLNPDQI